jgi:hypothetical protein
MEQLHAPRLDREYVTGLAGLGEIGILLPSLAVGDIVGRRQRFDTRIQKALSMAPPTPNLAQCSHKIRTKDGATITLEE